MQSFSHSYKFQKYLIPVKQMALILSSQVNLGFTFLFISFAVCCIPRYPFSQTTFQATAKSKVTKLSPCLLTKAWHKMGGTEVSGLENKQAPAFLRHLGYPCSGEVWPTALLQPCLAKNRNVSFPLRVPLNIEGRQ